MKFPIPSEAKASLMVVPAHLKDVTRGVGASVTGGHPELFREARTRE